jgi:hypothetical protein
MRVPPQRNSGEHAPPFQWESPGDMSISEAEAALEVAAQKADAEQGKCREAMTLFNDAMDAVDECHQQRQSGVNPPIDDDMAAVSRLAQAGPELGATLPDATGRLCAVTSAYMSYARALEEERDACCRWIQAKHTQEHGGETHTSM